MSLPQKKVLVVYDAKPGSQILVNLGKGDSFTRFHGGVPQEVDEDTLDILLKDTFKVLETKKQEEPVVGAEQGGGKEKNFKKGK